MKRVAIHITLCVHPSLQVMVTLHLRKIVAFECMCSHCMPFQKAWLCKNRTLLSPITVWLDLQALQFTFTILSLLYCQIFSCSSSGRRDFSMQGMRLCHFRSRASYRSGGILKFSPVFTKEHFKLTAKWMKDWPIDSPFKEDSRHIYFVEVCSYRVKCRGKNVNVDAVPFL